ncbi:MAG: hypothetical protein JJU36_01335, partial [Phycisphaeraceae bacterium]|nr:hypothetical protein [Phycisphaeraceae bacterium]
MSGRGVCVNPPRCQAISCGSTGPPPGSSPPPPEAATAPCHHVLGQVQLLYEVEREARDLDEVQRQAM